MKMDEKLLVASIYTKMIYNEDLNCRNCVYCYCNYDQQDHFCHLFGEELIGKKYKPERCEICKKTFQKEE